MESVSVLPLARSDSTREENFEYFYNEEVEKWKNINRPIANTDCIFLRAS